MRQSAVHVLISGRVQGVGYRYFAQEAARRRGLAGWVRNRPDGAVEAEAEGEKALLDAWLNDLRKGPPLSEVAELTVADAPATGRQGFEIRF